MIPEIEGLPNQKTIEKSQYKRIKEETGFNIESWHEIIRLQDELNIKVNPLWKTASQDWNLAMFLESAELVDSFDWKWWKGGKTDWANVEIEMVDLWHFIIAKSIELNQSNLITSLIISKDSETSVIPEHTRELEIQIQEIMIHKFVASLNVDNFLGAVLAWLEVWYLLGYSSTYLFKLYKMKFALNIFRQENGYKEGTYNKLWNGIEDNVYAQKFMSDIEDDNDFIDKLHKRLSNEYSKIQPDEKKTLENFIKSDSKWSAFIVKIPEGSRNIMFDLAKEFQDYLEK